MVIELPAELKAKLVKILENVARDINLHSLAIISKDGRNIAFWSAQSDVDPDLMSAISAAMLSMGEQTVNRLREGQLWEVIVHGSQGFTVMTKAGESLLLIGAGTQLPNLGLVVRLLREAGRTISDILS